MDQGKDDEPLPEPFKAAFSKREQETEARVHRLFNTAFYIASENLAFSKFKGLCNLQEKNGINFGIQYKCHELDTSPKVSTLISGLDSLFLLKSS